MALKRSSAPKPRRQSRSPSTGGTTVAELSGALHEVSNALTVVLGWIADARDRVASGPSREALDVAQTYARLGQSVARRAIGAPIASEENLRSCSSLAHDAVLGVKQEAARKSVRVEVQEPTDDVLVADAGYALQILTNLLFNAISFSPERGKVVLAVKNRASQLSFSVSDEGPGVPADMREAIFAGGDSRRPGGAGIGLAYCYGLANASGAQLALLESERGAVFELCWPVADAPSTTLERKELPVSLRGLCVVVLEDDPAVTCLLELGLGSQGVTMVSTTDAEEFEAAVREGRFHAALLDFSPLEANPRAVFDMLHKHQPNVPILLMSGSSMASEVDGAVSAWIRKPFELSEIYTALRRVSR